MKNLKALAARSFLAKIMIVAFIGTHVPLIAAVVVHMVAEGYFNLQSLGFILVATLVGTLATLLALRREIMPVVEIAQALEAFADRREILDISHSSQDEIGTLARSATWAIQKVDGLLKEVERKADTDCLTGLPNRRAFLDLAGAQSTGFVAILDLDHFKSINDTLGHHTGDRVLNAAAAKLGEELGKASKLARWGGEEFVVQIFSETLEDAFQTVDRARRALASARILDDRAVTISVGLSARTGSLLDDLSRADEALYRAKASGRNAVVVAQCAAALASNGAGIVPTIENVSELGTVRHTRRTKRTASV